MMKMANHKELLELSGLTPTEIAEIKLNTQIVGELLRVRNGAGISQQELEAISGVKQPLIARIERGKVDPQVTTILRMLQPLGKTLAIVPIEDYAAHSEN
jgi:predicted transcriptional regulator